MFEKTLLVLLKNVIKKEKKKLKLEFLLCFKKEKNTKKVKNQYIYTKRQLIVNSAA
jgi:hypothetical protein